MFSPIQLKLLFICWTVNNTHRKLEMYLKEKKMQTRRSEMEKKEKKYRENNKQ